MNKSTVKGPRTSEDPKYRDFSPHRMQKLITIHNETIQNSTNHTPQEMKDDSQLEKAYIIKKLYERERRTKITDLDLPEGTKVRYILQKTPLTKKRYKISPEYYTISGRDGHSYIIMAKDGTTKTISRWRLFPAKNIAKLKFGTTFSSNRGELSSIESFNPTTRKYDVKFKMPDGTFYNDTISEIDIRGSTPQIKTKLERDYFKRHPV
jgi:hypothetical protein